MGWEISDRDSASAALARVRDLAGRLDLDHPDPLYQAGKADQLAARPGSWPMTCGCWPQADGCAATWSRTTVGWSWPIAPKTPTCGQVTTATTTGPACPPALPMATTTKGAPMTAELLVCWIDRDYDR